MKAANVVKKRRVSKRNRNKNGTYIEDIKLKGKDREACFILNESMRMSSNYKVLELQKRTSTPLNYKQTLTSGSEELGSRSDAKFSMHRGPQPL